MKLSGRQAGWHLQAERNPKLSGRLTHMDEETVDLVFGDAFYGADEIVDR